MASATHAKAPKQITRVLTVGYVGVAALNLIAFAIAFGLYREASTLQDSFFNEQAPVALTLRNIAASSQILFLETEEIALQQTPAEIAGLRERVLQQEAQLATLANEEPGTPSDIRTSFASTAQAINSALDAQADALRRKEAISIEIEQLLALLRELDTKTTRAAYRAEANRSAWERTQLITSPWSARILVLSELAQKDLIETSRSATFLEMRSAAISVNRLPANSASTAVASDLYALLQRLQAPDNVFDSSIRLLSQVDATALKLTEAREAAAQFSQLVQERQTQFSAETNRLLTITAQATRLAETALIILALVAALTSYLLVRWVVMRGVAKPLRELAQRTDRIARGEYAEGKDDIDVDYEEFTLINDALHVFEANARQLVNTQGELREKNDVLEQTVADLERFSYAASHDLKSPLRGIQTLTQFALDDMGTDPNPALRNSLSKIKQRSRHLENTLNDLLNYARADALDATVEQIDLRELTDQIAELFSASDVAIHCSLNISHLFAPRAVIALTLRNLVDNAIKHHPARIHTALPVRDVDIHIQASERSTNSGRWAVLQVSDNGDGVPPEYRERVVELFETLRPKSETGNSGMGLSLIRKVISRHGAELELGEAPEGGLNVKIFWPISSATEHSFQSTAAT